MKLKKPSKENMDDKIEAKCTTSVKHRVQCKANIYTEGNLSDYVRYACLNFVPGKEDFENVKAPEKISKKKTINRKRKN